MRPSLGLPKEQFERVRREDKTGTRDGKGDLIKKLPVTPARPDPNRGQLMIPIRIRFDPPQVGEPDPTMQPRKEPPLRRMKITESMLQKYGYKECLEGCRAKVAGMIQKPPRRSLSETNRAST